MEPADGDWAQARLRGHSRLVVSAFGEEALNRLREMLVSRDAWTGAKRLAEVPPAGDGVGSPMSMGH